MVDMASVRIALDIPAERYVTHYAGNAHSVYTTAEGGLSVQFPATALRKFVTHDGVQGIFDLHFDRENKLTSITRVDRP